MSGAAEAAKATTPGIGEAGAADPAAVALAAARSRAYAVLAQLFEYPDAARLERIRSGAAADELAQALKGIDAAVVTGVDWAVLRDAGDSDVLAIEFTRLFDAGPSGTPPCPLYGGTYGGARMKTMEEVVRFYGHFGLELSDNPRELPDHLSTQLEFLHFLAFRETEALESGADAGPWRRAQRDFIQRHPGRWVPELRQRLEQAQAMRLFIELATCLGSFLASEPARLERQLRRT